MGTGHLNHNFAMVGHNQKNPQQMLQAVVCQSAIGLYPEGEVDLKSAHHLRVIADKLGDVLQKRRDAYGENGFGVFDTLLVLEMSALNAIIATNCPQSQTAALKRLHDSYSLVAPKVSYERAELEFGYA